MPTDMTCEVIDSMHPAAQRSGVANLPLLDFARLKRALAANAAFSTLTGLVLLVDPSPWVPHFAGAPPWALQLLGASLLGFAGWLSWLSTRRSMRLAFALATTVADIGWVVGSAILVVVAPLSPTGAVVVGGVALVVALIAVAQLHGIHRAIHAPDAQYGTRFHYRVSVQLPDVAPAALWPVIADLGSIKHYYPELADSKVDSAPGLGAVRSCTDRGGAKWREEVVGWEAGSRLDLSFCVDDPGFPLPMNPMVGGWWLVDEGAAGTRVTVWWSFTTKPAWAAPLMVPLMDARMHSSMGQVIRSMGAAAASSRATKSSPAKDTAERTGPVAV